MPGLKTYKAQYENRTLLFSAKTDLRAFYIVRTWLSMSGQLCDGCGDMLNCQVDKVRFRKSKSMIFSYELDGQKGTITKV